MTVTLRVEALTDLLVRALVAHRMSLENARIVESMTALLIGLNRRYKIHHAGIKITGTT